MHVKRGNSAPLERADDRTRADFRHLINQDWDEPKDAADRQPLCDAPRTRNCQREKCLNRHSAFILAHRDDSSGLILAPSPPVPVLHDPRFPYRNELEMPVIGLEAEFKVFIDDEAVVPEDVWRTPAAFIDRPLLKRTSKSSQLPTGGAVYFDGGVIEVVTPVIEIAPQCTARVVRSLWEQIGFVRDQLDTWEAKTGRRVRLQAFSCHYNISFELAREERSRTRTIQKLAFLLAHLIPVPVIVTGANRESTGIGVRPRRDRIEITLDFTPDPGLMAASAAMIVGIIREVIGWTSYVLTDVPPEIPLLEGIQPAKHPTRNGWIVRDYHFPRNPFTAGVDEKVWVTSAGTMSLREVALRIAIAFRDSIRKYSDPFSYRLLFSVLEGETPCILDLPERPAAYEDVGRATRWGTVLPELENFAALMPDNEQARRLSDVEEKLDPPWRGESPPKVNRERRAKIVTPSSKLTRSEYEKIFVKLGSGKRLLIGTDLLTPVSVKGWYHSVFMAPDGEERMLSIDQILQSGPEWR